MSNTTVADTKSFEAVKTSMARLDALADSSSLLATEGSPFTLAIMMATAINDIRATLTDPVMEQVIIPLMNSKLGFRTDKDPSRPVWKNGRKEIPEPYPISTVRECAIEAILRGLPVVGNCWNIIAAQTYVTKEGFWFLLGKKVPGLTDFKNRIGVPKMIRPAGDARNANDEEAKGALVVCNASWKLNGVADQLEREIPIRVNAMMGSDAIMGKAERKLLAACYAQITGTALGDADASEAEIVDFRNVTKSSDRNASESAKSGNAFSDYAEDEPPAVIDEIVEEFIPAQALEYISGEIRDAEITMPRFEGMLKKVGLLNTTETVSIKLPSKKLKTILEHASAVIAGTYGKDQT